MTAEHIIGIGMVIDETMRALGHTSHRLAGVSDAQVPTVAVVAAAVYGNHHARALAVLRATGYLPPRARSTSRSSRRLHALADWLAVLLDVRGDLCAHGQAASCDFIIDRLPVPVCKRVRARRCRTVRGRAYGGYRPPPSMKTAGAAIFTLAITVDRHGQTIRLTAEVRVFKRSCNPKIG